MKLVFSSGANRDIKKILEYYRIEAGADVAADIHSELETMIKWIKKWPRSFPPIGQNLRRAILRRFPHQIIFRIESDSSISVLVVRHHKQHPMLV